MSIQTTVVNVAQLHDEEYQDVMMIRVEHHLDATFERWRVGYKLLTATKTIDRWFTVNIEGPMSHSLYDIHDRLQAFVDQAIDMGFILEIDGVMNVKVLRYVLASYERDNSSMHSIVI